MAMGWACESERTCMMDAECEYHLRCWMVEQEDYRLDLGTCQEFPAREPAGRGSGGLECR